MKILLIGSGGREHAMARALAESASCRELWAAPGNPGIFQHAHKAIVNVNNHEELAAFCKKHFIELVVIGPDQALADGMSDHLRAHDIIVFGPSKAAARIEWSKSFAKTLMMEHHIPTAAFRRFTKEESDAAIEYVSTHSLPVVIKADGLALGKGVVVAESTVQAIESIQDMFSGAFSSAGDSVVVEDFLIGEEASVFAICDGERFVCLASAQDHKRALDGDLGNNTGGMGTYSPAPVVTDEVQQKVEQRIIAPLLDAMKEQGTPFSGCLFVGLMIDNGEPSVVEFNARFGDPETQSVLSVLDADFAALCYSSAIGALNPDTIRSISNSTACTVVMASQGYPESYEKGFVIRGIENAEKIARVYHAGTRLVDGELLTNGGRVLGVTALGATLHEAITTAYMAVGCIDFSNKYYRTDIGKKGLMYSTMQRENRSR